jgi:hypothetical protein
MSFDYQFKGRKPSYKQIMKVINNAVDWGNEQIDIGWGENCITIQRNSTPFNRMGSWFGSGWIKDISGDNIAKELNTR